MPVILQNHSYQADVYQGKVRPDEIVLSYLWRPYRYLPDQVGKWFADVDPTYLAV